MNDNANRRAPSARYWLVLFLLLLLLAAGIALLVTGVRVDRERPRMPLFGPTIVLGSGGAGVDYVS